MITLADMKAALGITAGTDDVYIQQQIDYYTAVIQLYTRRQLVRGTYTNTFYRPGTCMVQLSEFPVVSITRLEVDDVAVAASAWELQGRVGRLRRGSLGAGSFADVRKVLCEYVGGFDPIPDDLALVLIALVRGAYAEMTTGGITAASTSAAGSGDVKSVTAFGVMKVDYDTAASSGTVLGIERMNLQNLDSLLGNHVGILSRYVDQSKTLATAQD